MTADERKEIVELIKESRNSDLDVKKWTDWLFKALIAILVYLGSGIKSEVKIMQDDLSDLQSDVARILIQKQYQDQDILNLKDILREPRFTNEDYLLQSQPVRDQVSKNTKELSTRNAWMNETSDKILDIIYRLETIEKNQRK